MVEIRAGEEREQNEVWEGFVMIDDDVKIFPGTGINRNSLPNNENGKAGNVDQDSDQKGTEKFIDQDYSAPTKADISGHTDAKESNPHNPLTNVQPNGKLKKLPTALANDTPTDMADIYVEPKVENNGLVQAEIYPKNENLCGDDAFGFVVIKSVQTGKHGKRLSKSADIVQYGCVLEENETVDRRTDGRVIPSDSDIDGVNMVKTIVNKSCGFYSLIQFITCFAKSCTTKKYEDEDCWVIVTVENVEK